MSVRESGSGDEKMNENDYKRLVRHARETVRRWPDLAVYVSGDDLVNQVLAKEMESGQDDPPEKSVHYHKRSITNLAIDILRKDKSRREHNKSERANAREKMKLHVQPGPASASAQEPVARLQNRLSDLTRLLDRIAWRPGPRSRVDRYAVLIFHVRCKVAARAGPVIAETEKGSVADAVSLLLPWSREVSRLAFKQGWPSLAEMWAACSRDLARPPYRLDASMLADRVGELMDSGEPAFTPEAWHKWVSRAKEDAKKKAGEPEWSRTLAHVLG
jgi:DNA-directed RNA polymerase specialized sigma24 family protein